MIRRFAFVALALHALYALVWWLVVDVRNEPRFEYDAIRVTVTIAFLAYVVLVIAYWRARKTRLNTALAINKAYWALVIGVLFLPRLWWDTGWTAPGWLRVYLWAGLAVSIIGVLFEFWRINWGPEPPLPAPADQVDRVTHHGLDRRGSAPGRRRTDLGGGTK